MTDILVVEDNEELADLLCDFLRAENYVVSVAGTGEKALALYEKYGARLLVLDIMLPGMDGFSLCAKVREQGNTPILIVSAKTAKDDKLNGLLLGADDYIEKPYDIDILLAKIKGIFKRRYSLDEITVWGSDSFSEPQTLTVHIKWLRQKIEDNPKKPQKIQTVWGVGYKFI